MRTAAGLKEVLQVVARLRKRGISPRGDIAAAYEAANALTVAEMVARAALMRTESRGPHLRFSSFTSAKPQPSSGRRWERYIVIRRIGPRTRLIARQPVRVASHL